MEHRYSTRTNTDIQALIYKLGVPVVVGRARNVSRHGVFVECAGDGLALHQRLEIELLPRGNHCSRNNRFECFVARKDRRGIAVAILDGCLSRYAERADALASSR